MMINDRKNIVGMTLVEMLFCSVIFSLIMGACVSLLLTGWRAWQTSSAQVQVTQGLNQSVAWLSNDIRQTGGSMISNVPADNNPYTQISFSTSQGVSGGNTTWGPAIDYALGGVDGHQLIRTQNSQARVVATGIMLLQFSRLATSPNVVNIQLTAKAPSYMGSQFLTSSLNIKVLLRNS